MYHGITFKNSRGIVKRSWEDWGLVPKEPPKMDPPTADVKLVSIPGSDTFLNLSKALDGRLHFSSRQCQVTFLCVNKDINFDRLYTEMLMFLNGQEVKAYFDDDNGFYWDCVVVVSKSGFESNTWDTIEITITANPYKYADVETVIKKDISAGESISILVNSPTEPKIISSVDNTVSYRRDGESAAKTYSLTAGVQATPFVLCNYEGLPNALTFSVAANIQITYREATL